MTVAHLVYIYPVFGVTLKYASLFLIFLLTAICPEQSLASDMPNVFLNRDFNPLAPEFPFKF